MRYSLRGNPLVTPLMMVFTLGMLWLGWAWISALANHVPYVPCPTEYIQHCRVPECRVDTE